MFALDIMLAVFTAVSPASSTALVPRPDVEVIGPTQTNRIICRIIGSSGSHIPARRVCQTQAEIEEARDRMQHEAGDDISSTNRRTNEVQENSGYGIWLRSHPDMVDHQIGITDARQTGRGD